MKPWVGAIRNEKGVALVLALFALLLLSALLVAFGSMAGMEPQISANLNDVTRARKLADAGIEWAFDALVLAPNINDLLTNGVMAPNQPLPGLTAASGTFSVSVRNDNQPGDTQITGLLPDPGGPTNDLNNVVIITATGTYNNVTRQVQVAMSGPWDVPSAIFENNVNFLASCCGNVAWGTGKWLISGDDTNLDGKKGAGASKLGIAYTSPSNVAAAIGTLSPTQMDQVQGVGDGKGKDKVKDPSPGPASIGQLNPVPWHLTVPALTALVNQLAAKPDQVVTAGYTGNLMKADGSPQVTLADLSAGGQLKLDGTQVGRGILIVKGGGAGSQATFAMDGNARFEGLIIICCNTGGGTYDAEIQGNSQVFGSMINFSAGLTPKDSLFNIENTAQILRSVQGMAYARQFIPNARGRLWSWREF